MNYPTHWRMAYIVAFFSHLLVWLFVSLLVPHLGSVVPEASPVQEIEWRDFPEDISTGSETEGAAPGAFAEVTPESIPESNPLPAPEPPEETAEPTPPPKVEQVITPEESPELVTDEVPDATNEVPVSEEEKEKPPETAETEKEALEKLAKEKDGKKPQTIIIKGGGGGRQMAENARIIKPFYPAPGVVSFRGRVTVSARIGIDGRIKETKIMVTSGRTLVDAVAMNAAKRWIYKPATDKNGKPMECNAIISIPFQRYPAE